MREREGSVSQGLKAFVGLYAQGSHLCQAPLENRFGRPLTRAWRLAR